MSVTAHMFAHDFMEGTHMDHMGPFLHTESMTTPFSTHRITNCVKNEHPGWMYEEFVLDLVVIIRASFLNEVRYRYPEDD